MVSVQPSNGSRSSGEVLAAAGKHSGPPGVERLATVSPSSACKEALRRILFWIPYYV